MSDKYIINTSIKDLILEEITKSNLKLGYSPINKAVFIKEFPEHNRFISYNFRGSQKDRVICKILFGINLKPVFNVYDSISGRAPIYKKNSKKYMGWALSTANNKIF